MWKARNVLGGEIKYLEKKSGIVKGYLIRKTPKMETLFKEKGGKEVRSGRPHEGQGRILILVWMISCLPLHLLVVLVPVTSDEALSGTQMMKILGLTPLLTPELSIAMLSLLVKAVQPERITIEVPEAPDEVPSVGMVAVTQGCTRKGYTVLGSMMGLQRSFRQRSLHAIWVSL
ncbi:hypothetical protein DFJ43DRAFT_1140026 [Lentinula guzmanii]|uniref:Uncharacterized protein n=1 Tax=Lentinula guzmanii TaxID=2804957 RepID=A0AA38J7F7_9AGAR|nr:hypothetical protein DFJ43DRAFT_1140026 [Lentinula guzmanii]